MDVHVGLGAPSIPRVVQVGRSHTTVRILIRRYTVSRFGINYWALGGSLGLLNGEAHDTAAGCAYLYRPGDVYEGDSPAGPVRDCRYATFDWPRAADGEELVLRRMIALRGAAERGFVEILDDLLAAGAAPDRALEASGHLLRLLALWRRSQASAEEASRSPAVRASIEHMRRHLALPLSLADLARAAGQAADYYKRCFCREMGEPPFHYLIRLRLHEARRLLTAERGVPVARVATLCGFGDAKHFTRSFRRHFGLSPRELRADPFLPASWR